jgi:hypothetical protein
MEHAKQQKTVAINRGLFLVRYATAEDEAQPPKVRVSPDPASNKAISFLLHPDHDEAVLWQPDSCLVVRATAPGKLSVEVIPAQNGGSAAATVRIEALTQGQAAMAAPAKGRSSSPQELGKLRILGHVSGLGDVVVNDNEWIAGPSAPSRIEGISIEWPDKPADLDIHYAVKLAKPQAASGQKMGLGSYVGTRGKAMPLVGLMLELSGPGAPEFQLAVEAIFLGAPATRITGKRVVASGPTGREPLVGLRLAVENAAVVARPQPKSSAGKSAKPASRVRVFRSRSSHKQPVTV